MFGDKKPKVGIVIGEFHKDIAEKMLEDAKKKLDEKGAVLKQTVWIPGSFEAPLAAKKLLERTDIDCLVVLGFIEKGETMHGQQMGLVVAKTLKELELQYGKPIGMGIIGPGAVRKQALKRIGYAGAAVEASLKMLEFLKK